MNKEQRTYLRKLAEEATPGPWVYDESELPAEKIRHPDGYLVAKVAKMRTDGRHIAAANPSTILQLLDYIDTLEKDAARYLWLRDECVPEINPAKTWIVEAPGDMWDEAIDAAMQGEAE